MCSFYLKLLLNLSTDIKYASNFKNVLLFI